MAHQNIWVKCWNSESPLRSIPVTLTREDSSRAADKRCTEAFLVWDWMWSNLARGGGRACASMPPVPGLSYQVILLHGEKILLANCPHEVETVNSQVRPVTLCLQVGPCVSVQADSVECCSHGNGVIGCCCAVVRWKGPPCICTCIFSTQSPSHHALCRLWTRYVYTVSFRNGQYIDIIVYRDMESPW